MTRKRVEEFHVADGVSIETPVRYTQKKGKVCSACHVFLGLSDFGPDPRTSDGKQSRCRACDAERNHRKRHGTPIKPASAAPVQAPAAADPVIESQPPAAEQKAPTVINTIWRKGVPMKRKPAEQRTITIDFTGLEDLHDEICRSAAAEFRNPDQQLKYWLSKHVRGQQAQATKGAL